jgi:hypothetical protein
LPAHYYGSGGSSGSSPTAQQGVYYQGGQYVGPTGATGNLPGGTTPSALPGSVPVGGGVQKPGTTTPTQTYQPPSEAVFAKATATQTLGQPPTSIGYATIGGQTVSYAPSSYSPFTAQPYSEKFQEKAARLPYSEKFQEKFFQPIQPQTQKAFFYKQGPTTITPEGIAQTVFEPIVQPKEYGGMIAPVSPTISEWGELRQTYGTWATAKLFESKYITPKIQEFFGTTAAQREAEPGLEALKPKSQLMQAYDYFFGKQGSFALNLAYGKPKLGTKPPAFSATAGKTFSETMKQGYYGGVNEFISKPITKVVPSILIGAGFGAGFTAVENVVLRGMVASKPLLEAVTSPLGQLAYKGVQYGLVGTYVGAEALQVAKSPTPAYTGGGKLFEVPTVFAGARLGVLGTRMVTESEFVRRSFWGSPERRVAEVAGIKKITSESMSKAFETSETPYRAELKSMSAEQVKTELREASDVVWNLRGKYKPEVETITPTLIQERLGISAKKARNAYELLETYTPALKGSFVSGLQLEGVRGSRDIDPNLKDVAGFEKAAKRKGVSDIFDVHEMKEFAKANTAQLEPVRKAPLLSGKELKITGPIEQLSRKVEGSIKFFNVEPKGASRAKDFPDVLQMRKSIEKGERILPKPKEAELFRAKDLLKPSKATMRVSVKSEILGRPSAKSITPSRLPSFGLGLPSTYKTPSRTGYPSSFRNSPSSMVPSRSSKGSPSISVPSVSKPPSSSYKPSPSLMRSYQPPSRPYYSPGGSRSTSYYYNEISKPPSWPKGLGAGGGGEMNLMFEKPKGKKDVYTASLVALGLNIRAPKGRVRKSLLTPFGIRPILA